jgi:7-dehydrocholesterol reductase
LFPRALLIISFRETNGNTLIWGKKPQFIAAKYLTEDGQEHKSMLLVSGFWGLSRHFNYVPEVGVALFWSLPGLYYHFLPYIYVVYLTALLVHRSWRDEERCLRKYGKFYEEYKRKVPYFLFPYIY